MGALPFVVCDLGEVTGRASLQLPSFLHFRTCVIEQPGRIALLGDKLAQVDVLSMITVPWSDFLSCLAQDPGVSLVILRVWSGMKD